ncbi:major facilitator superfamily domain-containing protein [Chytriomyces cf. hyalinus JEL632]|nr:major facilitator superfamily domain-containing protein [Chytriomyces cf. hyalinus JEL632]
MATTAILFGIGFTWCVQFGYGTLRLMSLGVSKPVLALVWLAGPLSGLLVQPLVGALSDASLSRYGRRRPFILVGVLGICASVLAIAFAPGSFAIPVTVAAFYTLDFSLNTAMAASRALVVDVTPVHLQASANSWASGMQGLGTVFGYFAGFVDLTQLFGAVDSGDTVGQLRILGVITCTVLVFTTAVTFFSAVETPLNNPIEFSEEEEEEEGTLENVSSPTLPKSCLTPFQDILNGYTHLPRKIYRVCVIQFWAWLSWFPFCFYASSWIASKHTDPESEAAVRAGSFALLWNAIVSLGTMVLAPSLTGASHNASHIPRLFMIWSVSLVLFFLLMQSTVWMDTVNGATVIVGAAGVSWGIALWVPLGIISEHLVKDAVLSCDGGCPQATLIAGTNLYRRIGSSNAENGTRYDSSTTEVQPNLSAGLVLGIHNVFIVIPQLLSSLLTGFIFWVASESALQPSMVPHDDVFGVCLRACSVFALVSAWLCWVK